MSKNLPSVKVLREKSSTKHKMRVIYEVGEIGAIILGSASVAAAKGFKQTKVELKDVYLADSVNAVKQGLKRASYRVKLQYKKGLGKYESNQQTILLTIGW